ncbi:hypothetical protein AX16_003177 [Volvariella volvacea WC 439]|nr:hypothetical protein AX16_003177 [Volvariella volvacea WC 439]
MSAVATPNDSPASNSVQPLHNPSQAAHVAPAVAGSGPSLGAKALLAKKMAKTHNPAFRSPTDNLMTPCTQKLNAAKKKQFAKGTKPVQLFSQLEQTNESDEEPPNSIEKKSTATLPTDDDENPF